MCAVFYKRLLYTVTRDCFMEDGDHASDNGGKKERKRKSR